MSSTDTNHPTKARTKITKSRAAALDTNGRAPDGPSIAFSSIVPVIDQANTIPFDDAKFRAVFEKNGTGWEVEIKKRLGKPKATTKLVVEWTLDGENYGHEYAQPLEGRALHFKVANSTAVAKALALAAPGHPARVHLILQNN